MSAKRPDHLDPNDMYDLGNHEHLLLIDSSESSSESSTPPSPSTSARNLPNERESASSEASDIETASLLESEVEESDEPLEDGNREMLLSPRKVKASLTRKLMAFTTDSTQIEKLTNRPMLSDVKPKPAVYYNPNTGNPISIRLLSKREDTLPVEPSRQQVLQLVTAQAAHSRAAHKKWLHLCDKDTQLQRITRLSGKVSAATSQYLQLRKRTESLVAAMEQTLSECPAQHGYRWDYFREITAKWMNCLRGGRAFRQEFAANVEDEDVSLDNRSPLPTSARNSIERLSCAFPRSRRQSAARSCNQMNRTARNQRRQKNKVIANIRQMGRTQMRSCMRLPQLTEEEQQKIDGLLLQSGGKELGVLDASPSEPTAVANPFVLSGGDRDRLRVLNLALDADKSGDGVEKCVSKVRFAGTQQLAPARGRLSGLRQSDRSRVDWIDEQLIRLSQEEAQSRGLTEVQVAESEATADVDFVDFKARRIVKYALEVNDADEANS